MPEKPFVAYSQSRFANLLYSGVMSAVAGFHQCRRPLRLCTNEPDCEWPGTGSTMSLLDKILGPFIHLTAAAAQPALFAATSPKVAPSGYYGPKNVSEMKGPLTEPKIAPKPDDLQLFGSWIPHSSASHPRSCFFFTALFSQPDWYTFTTPSGTICLRH
jgi:hypothetical protein